MLNAASKLKVRDVFSFFLRQLVNAGKIVNVWNLMLSGIETKKNSCESEQSGYLRDILFVQGEKDWKKYETARQLHRCVDKIRANYREDWKSKEMRIRQRAVALYFIDKVM